jgi:hypothetical protein
MPSVLGDNNLYLREIVDHNLPTTATGGQYVAAAISNSYKSYGTLALRSKASKQGEFCTGSAGKMVEVQRSEYRAPLSGGRCRNRMVRRITMIANEFGSSINELRNAPFIHEAMISQQAWNTLSSDVF